jgi:hypothetical protein
LGHKSPEFERWPALARSGEIQVVETDASKLHGWSYHLCSSGRVVSGEWPEDWMRVEHATNSKEINYKELWVVLRCLEQERGFLRGWRVLFRVDNKAAEHYVNVRYGDVPSLESLAERIEAAEAAAACWALARHLRGAYNSIADLGSWDPEFARRWASNEFRTAMLRRDLVAALARTPGWTFTIDVFSDRPGWTSHASHWRCPEVTGFEADLRSECAWLFPPREILRPVLEWLSGKIKDGSLGNALLILPEDKQAPWFRPQLLRHFKQVQRWPAKSDLFRWADEDPRNPGTARYRKGPRSDLPFLALAYDKGA